MELYAKWVHVGQAEQTWSGARAPRPRPVFQAGRRRKRAALRVSRSISASAFEEAGCEAQDREQETGTENPDDDTAPEMECCAGEQERHDKPADDGPGYADEDVQEAAEAAASHDPAGE